MLPSRIGLSAVAPLLGNGEIILAPRPNKA